MSGNRIQVYSEYGLPEIRPGLRRLTFSGTEFSSCIRLLPLAAGRFSVFKATRRFYVALQLSSVVNSLKAGQLRLTYVYFGYKEWSTFIKGVHLDKVAIIMVAEITDLFLAFIVAIL